MDGHSCCRMGCFRVICLPDRVVMAGDAWKLVRAMWESWVCYMKTSDRGLGAVKSLPSASLRCFDVYTPMYLMLVVMTEVVRYCSRHHTNMITSLTSTAELPGTLFINTRLHPNELVRIRSRRAEAYIQSHWRSLRPRLADCKALSEYTVVGDASAVIYPSETNLHGRRESVPTRWHLDDGEELCPSHHAAVMRYR